MKVSVITVCLNAADTIADTFSSIRQQCYPDIEYIVVDGGSSDGTLAVIEQNHDLVSLLLTGPDQGMYDAANKGIRAASGDVVGLLNADDFYADAEVLTDVAATIGQGYDAVYGDLHYVDRLDTAVVRRNWVSGAYDRDAFRVGWMPPHPTFFMRRQAYLDYGLFRDDFQSAADYELMLRMLYTHGQTPGYINRVLVKMRAGGQSNVTLANRLRANREDCRAWVVNGLQAPWYLRYLKPLSKLKQFVNR